MDVAHTNHRRLLSLAFAGITFLAGFTVQSHAAVVFGGPTEVSTFNDWVHFRWHPPTDGLTALDDPYTFQTAGPGTLDITDFENAGDVFRIYDNGSLLGDTSLVAQQPVLVESDPDLAFASADWSDGTFPLAAGAHSITIEIVQQNGQIDNGGGFFRINAEPVPEPTAAIWLIGAGLPVLLRRRRTHI